MILDVAVTGVDGSDRKVGDHPDQPMIKRARQKIAKYRKSAEEHGFFVHAFRSFSQWPDSKRDSSFYL